MVEKKEVVGYDTGDGHIYCVECINKDKEIMEKMGKAITAKIRKKIFMFVIYVKNGSNRLI